MKKRMLSLLLAALAVLSLGVPALGDAPEDTPAPTLAPKDTPTETVVPTTEPTEAPMETATPTLEPTEVPMGTVVHTSEATVPPEETISPTLEPIIALEETITPTLEPTEMPEEMADPTEGPEESPEPDGEIMLLAEEGGKYVLDKTEVTMYSTLRPITLTVYMQPYESITVTSGRSPVPPRMWSRSNRSRARA